MSGSASNLPVRITVDGVPQAEAAFNQLAASGQRAMDRVQQGTAQASEGTRNFGNAIGQAGFQLQDFATQVSMGQNALTAFSTQASQFLGVFGTGGAIAGAVLTVGVLAASLLRVGDNSEAAKDGIDNFTKSLGDSAREAERVIALLSRVEARFLSIAERARTAQLREVTADIAGLNNEARDAQLRLLDRDRDARLARARAAGLTQQVADLRNPSASFGGAGVSEAEIRALERQRDEAVREAQSAELDVQALQGQITRYERLIERSEGLIRGLVEDGTNSNPGRAEDLREPRASAGARGQAVEDRFLASEALARRTAAAALERGATQRARDIGNEFEQTAKQIERADDVTRQLGLTFNSAFEDAIGKGARFSDVLKGIEQDLARLIIRQAVTQPLANALNPVISSLTGQATDYVSGFFPRAELTTGTFGGYKADGGPVSPDQWYMVGERGPEVFVPNVPGSIIPNGAGGGISVTHAPVFQISGGGGLSAQQRAEALALAQAANADLIDRINRGGSLSRVVGRR